MKDPDAADKRAIEKVWREYWKVYATSTDFSAGELKERISAVAVDPIKHDVIKQAAYFHDKGLANYGLVKHRIEWDHDVGEFKIGVDGKKALMADCTDQSAFGTLYVKTKEKRTIGVSEDLAVGEFVLDNDHRWRVSQLYYTVGIECPK